MKLGQQSLITNNANSDINVYDLDKSNSDFIIDKVTECLTDHRKCTGEYTNPLLKISFICFCNCHKEIKSVDEVKEKLINNICTECGNNHCFNTEHLNTKKNNSWCDMFSQNKTVGERKYVN